MTTARTVSRGGGGTHDLAQQSAHRYWLGPSYRPLLWYNNEWRTQTRSLQPCKLTTALQLYFWQAGDTLQMKGGVFLTAHPCQESLQSLRYSVWYTNLVAEIAYVLVVLIVNCGKYLLKRPTCGWHFYYRISYME